MDIELQSHPAADVPRGIGSRNPSYYIHKDEVMYGPDSVVNLRRLCEAGWLRPDDLVWEEGAPEWLTAGVVFASFFGVADRSLILERAEDEIDFFHATAVRLSAEKPWPWGSLGLAIAAHVILLLLLVALFQFFPFKIVPYASPPPTQEPPLEVAMVTEPEPAPPPPLTPPDPTPPPVDIPPPPVPAFATELPPPPPAPVEMPIPSIPLPILPAETMLPDEVAAPPKLAKPGAHAHQVAKALGVVATKLVAPRETPPPPVDAGPAEYLVNPRPPYPYSARLRHQEGTVLLLVTLDAAGNPTSVSIQQSSGSSVLDEAARQKVAADWRFKPGQASTLIVPVEFHLEE